MNHMLLATAAFDALGKNAKANASAACAAAVAQGADLLVLPGVHWQRADLVRLSRENGGLLLCAACGEGGRSGLLLRDGDVLLMQAALYGEGAEGEDIALIEAGGMTLAVLAGEDALQPQAARLATLRGATLLLCPTLLDESLAGVWAQVQQNGVFAACAPSSGEARIYAPLGAHVPDGILARGKTGTMAMARLSALDVARARIAFDPLSYLNRRFAATVPPPPCAEEPPAAPMTVAVVQRTLRVAEGKAGLLRTMEAHCKAAADAGCKLIAFPEYNWLDTLGSLPFVRRLIKQEEMPTPYLDTSNKEEVEAFFPAQPAVAMPSLAIVLAIHLAASSMARTAVRETARLARTYNLTVHGGTFFEKKKKKLYNTAVIASPMGKVLLQRKLCPTQFERTLGIQGGEDLAAFELHGALCCAPVCMDATYTEPFTAARRVGCDIAIVPICNGEPYFEPAALRGSWARAIESCLYILKPALTGSVAGMHFTGNAGIYGPSALPIALSHDVVGDALLIETLDFTALRQERMLRPADNPALEEHLREALQMGGRIEDVPKV